MRPDPKLYALSDGLKALRSRFAGHCALEMNGRGVAMIVEEIEMLRERALQLEHEISRRRWNDQARLEQEETEAVLEAFHRPGSNIVLFPAIDRSNPFSPGGAA
jgi:hypothetical protein